MIGQLRAIANGFHCQAGSATGKSDCVVLMAYSCMSADLRRIIAFGLLLAAVNLAGCDESGADGQY